MRVELKDIRKYFGDVRANDGITLTFEPGRIYGLLGENGAGKSTLMKILSGYQPPTGGEIVLNGRPGSFVNPLDALDRGIGMLYQDPLDFPPLQVVENHQLAYDDNLALDLRTAQGDLREYAGGFGFHIEPRSYVDTLTLGERQQMELLRLLALGAELLILDEPTTGISAEQKDTLFDTMRRLAHDEGKTIILVSHKLEEVQDLCDEVAVLRRGQLVGTQDIPCETRDLVRMMFGEDIPKSERAKITGEGTALVIDDATVQTYRLTVKDVSLSVNQGEVIGLAGLEGSGQRLLLRACAGLEPLAKGSIQLDGQPVKARRSPVWWLTWLAWPALIVWTVWTIIRAAQSQITGIDAAGGVATGLLIAGGIWLVGTILIAWTGQSAYHRFQAIGGAYVPAGRLEEGLVPGLTLTEHMVLTDQGDQLVIDWKGAHKEVAGRIDRYKVVGRPDSKVDELSGGNQQRFIIGLLDTPLKLILLEHPTRGLDVTSADHIWTLFGQRRQDGTAILFMSADLDELLERSDRIAVFSGGIMTGIVNATETTVDELGHLIGGQQA